MASANIKLNNGIEILVAEDSLTQAEQLKPLLEECGYTVAAAPNGRQALAIARERKPALVISDIVMPEMDGYQLCKAIKSDENLIDIPVILVTSLSSPQDVIRGLECGADSFIRKPYDEKYLLSRLEYALANRALRQRERGQMGLEIVLGGQRHFITSERQQILDLLISTYEEVIRLDEGLRRSNQSLNGLYRIAGGLNQAGSEREVCEMALERAMELPGVQAGWISLREGESGFRVGAAHGLPPALEVPGALEGACMCRRRLLAGELDQVTNILDCERLQKAGDDTRSLRYHASIPLWVGERMFGLMNLAGSEEGLFSDEDLKILYGVGNQMGIALERARLREHLEELVEQRTAKLRESEERFRAWIENSSDLVTVVGLDGTIQYESPSIEHLLGYKPDELIGANGFDLIHPDDRERVMEIFTQNIQMPEDAASAEFRVRHRDGSWRVFEGVGKGYLDEHGQMAGLINSRDVTERKRAEETLRQRLTELEAVYTVSTALRTSETSDGALPILLDETLAALETDAGAIWLYDPEVDELRAAVSRGWFQQFGKTPMNTSVGIAGTVFRSGQLHLSAEFRSDPLVRVTTRGQAPPGWGGACIPIHAGATTVGVLFVSVLHPRQIAAEQLRLLESLAEIAGATLHRLRLWQETQEQARRVQAVMDTAATGMLLLDADGRILLANPVAAHDLAALAGAGSEQPLTHLGELLVSPAQGSWHEVQAGARIFEVLARPMTDRDGEVNRNWVLVLNDVTADREQQRYQQVQERLATVGQLAAGIAHDFNNIMGVIVLYAGILRKAPDLGERQQRQLDTINNQAQHAAALIRQILDFSRRSVMQLAPLDLLPLVKELVKLLERTLPENIRLELAYDRSEYVVNGDPTRLQQALMNLAINARDALPGGGQLSFTCSALSLAPGQPPPLPDMAAGEWLCLAVADTGTGIPAAALAHLFEPFFTTKEPGKGTGLGLAQVYGIVKQHDGHIAVQSQEGKGATFTLYLPVLMASPLALPAPKADTIQGQDETILVVEDNQDMRIALADTLKTLNYRVLEAANGREALALLEQQTGEIDLVLSDLVMPEMGGEALIQVMRVRGLTLPVAVLSGHPLTTEMQALQAQGLAGWLLKPPDVEELAALLARALGKKAA